MTEKIPQLICHLRTQWLWASHNLSPGSYSTHCHQKFHRMASVQVSSLSFFEYQLLAQKGKKNHYSWFCLLFQWQSWQTTDRKGQHLTACLHPSKSPPNAVREDILRPSWWIHRGEDKGETCPLFTWSTWIFSPSSSIIEPKVLFSHKKVFRRCDAEY